MQQLVHDRSVVDALVYTEGRTANINYFVASPVVLDIQSNRTIPLLSITSLLQLFWKLVTLFDHDKLNAVDKPTETSAQLLLEQIACLNNVGQGLGTRSELLECVVGCAFSNSDCARWASRFNCSHTSLNIGFLFCGNARVVKRLFNPCAYCCTTKVGRLLQSEQLFNQLTFFITALLLSFFNLIIVSVDGLIHRLSQLSKRFGNTCDCIVGTLLLSLNGLLTLKLLLALFLS